MATFDRASHTTKWISVKELSVIWPSAQRVRNDKWVKKIVDEFDPDLFGVISVTLPNVQGIYHVIDGQHRIAAISEIFGQEEKVPCNVFNAEDPIRAAQLFDKLNSARKKPERIDTFKVRVTAGYEDEVAINGIIRALGYKIDYARREGNISAVEALTYIYKKHGGVVLSQALSLIKKTWGRDPEAVMGTIIRGYGVFLADFPAVDQARMVDRVAKKFTPARLYGAARTLRDALQSSTEVAVRQILINTHDQNLRNGARLVPLASVPEAA